MSREDLVLVAEQLAALVKTGLPLPRGIRDMARGTRNAHAAETLETLADELDGGAKLSDALARQPRAFPPEFAALAAAGERSGKLAAALEGLASLSKLGNRYRYGVFGAGLYSTAAMFLYSSAISGVLSFAALHVTKGFAAIFTDLTEGKSELPELTRFALYIGDKFLPYAFQIFFWIAAALALWLVLIVVLGRVNNLARLWFRLPIWGRVAEGLALARWARLMGMLLQHGVSVSESLMLTAQAAGNRWLSRATSSAAQLVGQGRRASDALDAQRVFPLQLIAFVRSGEEKGNLADALLQAAQIYEERAESAARYFESRQERLLPLLIALVVLAAIGYGICVLGFFLPLISIITQLQG